MMWITQIANFIKNKFNFVRAALPVIPPMLLVCEASRRPGLSAIALATAIIQRLPEAGISVENNPCGEPNKIMKAIRIGCEEFVNEFKNNSRVSMVLPTGSVTITGTGPYTFTATNLLPVSIEGIAL